jgi:hypothetical protein
MVIYLPVRKVPCFFDRYDHPPYASITGVTIGEFRAKVKIVN